VVVGDTLLDRDVEGRVERLCPDAPAAPVVDEVAQHSRPGGAGLAAVLAAGDGRDVVLVTALSDDAAGRELAGLLASAGVDVVDLGLDGPTPEKVRIRTGDRSLLRVDRGCGGPAPVGEATDAIVDALGRAAGVLVSDYGRGVAASPSVRRALSALPARVPLVWDPHARGAEPVPGCRLLTPNRAEAAVLTPAPDQHGLAGQAARARHLRRASEAAAVVITMGDEGALLVEGDGPPLVVPAPRVTVADPCGAGDRFAATAASLLAGGALVSEAVVGAVAAASTFVAAGGAGRVRLGAAGTADSSAAAEPAPADATALIAGVRGAGGTVVATGGCFDMLHAGHVSLLEGARALGDCLVVCLNSDASVRRLKGPGRPVSSQGDRAAVLLALECVDAVATFDEDTPTAVLDRLRPDVWVKGGDYAGTDLPEASLLERWGGQAVVLPYLQGRSTTRLLQEALARVTP
jgi:rfaE bifunctional protein nucleotidyltransferase chain/domain/rfaE bifunctional protein kinase chain/domain